MKKKAFKIIAIVLGVLVVIAGSVTWFFLSIKKDQRATKERVEVVVKTYKTFSDEVDKFNDIRNDLYLNVFDNIACMFISQKLKIPPITEYILFSF